MNDHRAQIASPPKSSDGCTTATGADASYREPGQACAREIDGRSAGACEANGFEEGGDDDLPSDDVRQIVAREEAILKQVLESIREQVLRAESRLHVHSRRSLELTASLVAATTDEDRALIASDEAVSHALTDKAATDLPILQKQLSSPYFARFIIWETINGKEREVEYRLGLSANPDCRIVDWRQAPIAKIFYEYQEGEHFSEEIQGTEREGQIILRQSVRIENGVLKEITSPKGRFVRKAGEWRALSSVGSSGTGHLPAILGLVTAEQFEAITKEQDKAVLIQGVAGSGKTTVALYRLSWLLSQKQAQSGEREPSKEHGEENPLSPDRCLILVSQKPLRSYIRASFGAMGLPSIPIKTYREWAAEIITRSLPAYTSNEGSILRPSDSPSSAVSAAKEGSTLVLAMERRLAAPGAPALTPEELVAEALDDIAREEPAFAAAAERFRRARAERWLDYGDDPLLVRAIQLTSGVQTPFGSRFYDHIVADEVQDLSIVGVATVIGGVQRAERLTLVGDLRQRMDGSSAAPLWDELERNFGLDGSRSNFIKLDVAHRSTAPILSFANYISPSTSSKSGTASSTATSDRRSPALPPGRAGRVPIVFRTFTEQQGVGAGLKWLQEATRRYPAALTAVLCRDRDEARFVYSLLRPTFSRTVRVGDGDNFSFGEGIVVTEIRQVKGLEFFNVLVWNTNAKRFGQSDNARAALYIASTRAQENLAFTAWGRLSPLFPSGTSRLIRLIEPSEDE